MKKNLIILGAGESGVGAAILGQAKGYDVFVSDNGKIKDSYKDKLKNKGISYEEEGHSFEKILQAGLIVKSPGIPNHIDLIQKIKSAGIPILSEIEFASRYANAKLINCHYRK